MRYTSKQHLRDDIVKEHDALVDLLATVPEDRYRESGVWGDDWTIHDLVAHLAEWHRMFLGWHATGLAGDTPDMPATASHYRFARKVLKRWIKEQET